MDYDKYKELKALELQYQQVTLRIPVPLINQIDLVVSHLDISRNRFIVEQLEKSIDRLSKKFELN